MDLEGRGGSEELEGVEGGEIMIELYCMRRESIFSKRGGNTCCSYRGAGFDSQHPHGGPEASVTLVTRDSVFFSGICRHLECIWCTDKHVNQTPAHVK